MALEITAEEPARRSRLRAPWLPAPWLLGGLIAATLGVAAALMVQQGAHTGTPLPASRGLDGLPVAARARISDLLGENAPGFAIRDLRGVNRAQGLRIAFSDTGAIIASGSARIGITLTALGYGDALRGVTPALPQVHSNTVTYSRGAVREWFANGTLGVEQGFDLSARPAGGAGPLTLSLALSGGISAQLDHGSVLLQGHGALLRYTGLVATDARGRTLHSWIALSAGRILIRVDDRRAAYPLRIDPLVQQALLTQSSGLEGSFGYSSAISGKTIVIGDPSYDGTELSRGAAYVFEEPTSGWANAHETVKLLASDGKEENFFGESVGVSGNTVAVGAFEAKTTTEYAKGAVYIFTAPTADWAAAKQVAELSVPEATESGLGVSLALSSTTLVTGAPFSSGSQGAAFVFVKPAGGWSEDPAASAELIPPKLIEGCPEFGESVALSGNTVLVGAPGTYRAGSNCAKPVEGHAYVYVAPGGAGGWSGKLDPTVTLTPSVSAGEDLFGSSVALSEKAAIALVGAPRQTVGSDASQGAAYLFREPEAGWTGSPAQTLLTNPAGTGSEEFGHSVAIAGEGGTVFVGATGFEQEFRASTSGVYVFAEPASGWGGSLGTPERIGGLEYGSVGYSLADEGSTLLAATGGGVYVFGPGLGITISSPGNGATYTPGQSVLAAYSCSAPAPYTVTKCAGPVADGAPIETSTAGLHSFTVEYEDSDGNKASASSVYRVASPTVTEVTSTTGTTPTTVELTTAEKAAAEAAKKAHLEKELAEFIAWIQAVASNPENATIGSRLLTEGGFPVSYKLVPEPGLIGVTGATVHWYKPTGSAARVGASRRPKPVVVFNVNHHVTRAGAVSFKVLLTKAGRKLIEKDLKTHRSLTIYWTVGFTPIGGRKQTKTFRVTLKSRHSRPRS
jgi:hypothetical protein